jgi:hypothetical protein
MMTIIKELTKYWVLQAITIVILGSYIFGMGYGLVLFLNNSPEQTGNVNVLLIIESNHPEFSFNFSYTSEVPSNYTLIDYLNDTIGSGNWDGTKYNPGGWFVQRIFNASEQGNWKWLIYYRVPGDKSWIISPVGASTFKLNRDYEIKFLFTE